MIRFFARLGITAIVLIVTFLLGSLIGSQGFLSFIFGPPVLDTNVVAVLDQIQDMSQLTTTRYTYSNYITTEREMPPILAGLYGERLVMVAVGHVTAGIDLSQLTEEDIQTAEGSMTITLPAPELQDCFFNETASYVISRDTGLFAQPIPEMDLAARRFALQESRNNALEAGIMDDARIQAEAVIGELINLLNNDDMRINILFAPADSDTELPETCQ